MSERKPFRKFRNTGPSLTIEQKIEQFILRNSKNGYFTKVSTINYKFEISESKAWEIVGELLFNGNIESIHDQNTGTLIKDAKAIIGFNSTVLIECLIINKPIIIPI